VRGCKLDVKEREKYTHTILILRSPRQLFCANLTSDWYDMESVAKSSASAFRI